MKEQVDVLLATYQGASFLEEQLISIFTQTYPYIHLWVRDDGSTDQTKLILERWSNAYPQKMTVIPTSQNLGIKGNFSELLKSSKAGYVMFADQDDRWFPHKVESSLEQLKYLECHFGCDVPLLIHTDLKVADQNLHEIAPSFWEYAGLNPCSTSINRLLVQNGLTGCTMLMNRCLVDLASPVPEEAIMHDWWIALVASCLGYIDFVDEPTLLYRQHENNDTGAKNYGIWNFIKYLSGKSSKKNDVRPQTFKQAEALLKRYGLMLGRKGHIVDAYVELQHLSYFGQRKQILKYLFFKQGFLRNVRALLSKAK